MNKERTEALIQRFREFRTDPRKFELAINKLLESEDETMKELVAEMLFYFFLTQSAELEEKMKEIDENIVFPGTWQYTIPNTIQIDPSINYGTYPNTIYTTTTDINDSWTITDPINGSTIGTSGAVTNIEDTQFFIDTFGKISYGFQNENETKNEDEEISN